MFKMAYCGIPHIGGGGLVTFYRMLRKGLKQYAIDLRWVGLAESDYPMTEEFKKQLDYGELLYIDSSDQTTGKKFVEHITKNYQGVIFNVLANRIQMNAARYIPHSLLKLGIVHNITPATYRAAKAIQDHVHATIGVSSRIGHDLMETINFSPNKVLTIPHSVDLAAFQKVSATRKLNEPLKLVFLGRIEENAKGVLWLPEILKECLKIGLDVSLTIAGDGKDLTRLKQKISKMGLSYRIQCIGKVNHLDVPNLLVQHHVFLMTSRYEGFGYTLIEAMASGCVPVCSLIAGVTDSIILDGENGLLFKVGSVKEAVNSIHQLENIETWKNLSEKARKITHSRFSLENQAHSYANLISDLRENPPVIALCLPIEKWQFPPELQPGLSAYLPDAIKNRLRVWLAQR